MEELVKCLRSFLNEKNYISPWMYLDSFDWGPFTKNNPPINIKKGSILYHQGDINEYLYIVKSGRLRLFLIDQYGNEKCICIAGKGSMLGEVSIIDNIPNYVSAFAIIDSSVYRISKNEFMHYISKNALLTNYVMRNLTKKIRLMNSEMEYFSKDALTRISISLISLCAQYGIKYENGIKINIKFTHEELANLTGLNRVTVSKTYKTLFSKKIIYKKNGYIIVNDMNKLKEYIS